jgi:hypothetical protein
MQEIVGIVPKVFLIPRMEMEYKITTLIAVQLHGPFTIRLINYYIDGLGIEGFQFKLLGIDL